MMRGLKKGSPALILAPMQGITDFPMRDLQTSRGGLSLCVSEFIRISHEVPPEKVFLRHVPELKQKSMTSSGVPVQVQLLGGDPDRLARSAQVAVSLGAWGVDLNFGCPAKTVNNHDGGAVLLKYPKRIYEIVKAVRASIPRHVPVSAKLRLGWDSTNEIYKNAEKAVEGGVSWITIHGRTRMQGYSPPVLWKPIGEVRKLIPVPVVANGDLWNVKELLRCQHETGCEHFMIGRGTLASPWLAVEASKLLQTRASHMSFGQISRGEWAQLLESFGKLSLDYGSPNHDYVLRRMKQWLSIAQLAKSIDWFDEVKHAGSTEELLSIVSN